MKITTVSVVLYLIKLNVNLGHPPPPPPPPPRLIRLNRLLDNDMLPNYLYIVICTVCVY